MAKASINNARFWRIVEVRVVRMRRGTRNPLGSSLVSGPNHVYKGQHLDGGERSVLLKRVELKSRFDILVVR